MWKAEEPAPKQVFRLSVEVVYPAEESVSEEDAAKAFQSMMEHAIRNRPDFEKARPESVRVLISNKLMAKAL